MNLERALADAPRWLFLMVLFCAPLAYGCTRASTITLLNQAAAVLVVLWLGGCAWRRRWPAIHWLPVAVIALLLLQGWWLAWNAHSLNVHRTWLTFNRTWDFPPLPDWPGALDRHYAHAAMLNFSALAVLFLFACDLMVRPLWRKRAWATMALSALAVAVLGIALKLGGPEWRRLLWDEKVAELPTTFAAYRYHGNAASLMSLGLALTLGFVVAAAGERGRPARLAAWAGVALLVLAGLFLNNSRAGWALAVLLTLAVAGRFGWSWWHTRRMLVDWRVVGIQAAVLLVVAGILLGVGMQMDWREKLGRFHSAAETLRERYPSKVYRELASETGWLGYGADCFQVALPPYMEIHGLATEKYGFWRHAHNDYYEYLANWGWWGLGLWAVLIGGGLRLNWREHFSSPPRWGSTQWALGFTGCLGMGAMLLHSLWDFPLEKASILLFFLTLTADGWARGQPPAEKSA